ncbi:23S rRNA (guanosine(2251)-2'-O)-methyltransferase RlmB [Rhodothermus profundi]|uniref:23S rRNA (Guanosine2251-2'-O)-methyltransferase n=1 Tax=Rhodothermus profundi TaxID=633813 RepID=A0A1M6PX49_9BACT|nr:23S rRNA (guanosine(2251)-2'-O)-methyltransferase RlmB [Rhodothermus profundi]SHK12461.1 23S rRNA (guanosine2251-2'-O)-methyltransferase [Rhodothermus profundi]
MSALVDRLVGRNPVREALEQNDTRVEKVFVQEGAGGSAIEAIRRAARAQGIPVQIVPKARLDRLASGATHQGVVAFVAPVAYRTLEDLLREVAPSPAAVQERQPLLVALDQIEDPHNYGAILRTAVAAGVAGVLVPRHHMAPLNTVALKASAGAALRVPIARVTNLARALETLKTHGFWVAGASPTGSVSVWEMDWHRPLVLVLGNEGRGLRPRVVQACDLLVSIPLRGPVASLNVSVAAGILLFAATRSRQ